MKKKVVILGMGGTISSVFSDKGFTPEKSSSELLALVPEIKENYQIETRELLTVDSSTKTILSKMQMSNCIFQCWIGD